MKSVILSMLILSLVCSCGTKSPKEQGPLVDPGLVQMNLEKSEVESNSKVDILFVVDNSISMDHHQKNLAANINKFVKAFAKNGMIDYHIGVTTVYDSKKFGTVVTDFLPNGTLIAPKDTAGAAIGTLPYITRFTPNLTQVLSDTLKVGTKQGPEFEESFSPVVAALSSPINGDFYRPEAYLAVFFITDADDNSPELSYEDLYYKLLAAKNEDRKKVLTYGVISPPGEACKKDPSGPPVKIIKFLTLSGGSAYSLCSSQFGDNLAQIGIDLSKKVGRQVISLPSVPVTGTLKVMYGSQVIPNDVEKGWSYNASKVEVVISSDLEVIADPTSKIQVEYVPAQLGRAQIAN